MAAWSFHLPLRSVRSDFCMWWWSFHYYDCKSLLVTAEEWGRLGQWVRFEVLSYVQDQWLWVHGCQLTCHYGSHFGGWRRQVHVFDRWLEPFLRCRSLAVGFERFDMYANMICDRALEVSCRAVAPIKSEPTMGLVGWGLLTCTLGNCACGMILHILGIVGYCGANLFRQEVVSWGRMCLCG